MMDAEPTELQQLSRSELVAKIVDLQGQIDQAAELGQAMMGQLEGLGHAKDEAARLSAEAEDMRVHMGACLYACAQHKRTPCATT
eukprot:SAG31_NODE_276_length_18650_cov_5.821842_7_plen_85_part_00